jgi:hypothetical protein
MECYEINAVGTNIVWMYAKLCGERKTNMFRVENFSNNGATQPTITQPASKIKD